MPIKNMFEQRLAAYGAMSLALAAAGAPEGASAAPISHNEGVTATADSPVFFNPASGQIDAQMMQGDYELLLEIQGLKSVARLSALGNSDFAVSPFTSMASMSSAARLSAGDEVGAARTYANLTFSNVFSTLASNSAGYGHFAPVPQSGYLGLRVGQGSDVRYGWAEIAVNADFSITLRRTGWDATGAAIQAGQGELQPVNSDTPEPASILLLTLGAAGIAAYRRKLTTGKPAVRK